MQEADHIVIKQEGCEELVHNVTYCHPEALEPLFVLIEQYFAKQIQLPEWYSKVEALLGQDLFQKLLKLLSDEAHLNFNPVVPLPSQDWLNLPEPLTLLPFALQPTVLPECVNEPRNRGHKRKYLAMVEDAGKRPGRGSPKTWTPDESKMLISLVLQMREKSKQIDWVAVANSLNSGKSSAQCSQHWNRVADPSINKGPWSAEEEGRLLESQKLHINKWAKIAKELPGRTDIQCRHKYFKLIASEKVGT